MPRSELTARLTAGTRRHPRLVRRIDWLRRHHAWAAAVAVVAICGHLRARPAGSPPDARRLLPAAAGAARLQRSCTYRGVGSRAVPRPLGTGGGGAARSRPGPRPRPRVRLDGRRRSRNACLSHEPALSVLGLRYGARPACRGVVGHRRHEPQPCRSRRAAAVRGRTRRRAARRCLRASPAARRRVSGGVAPATVWAPTRASVVLPFGVLPAAVEALETRPCRGRGRRHARATDGGDADVARLDLQRLLVAPMIAFGRVDRRVAVQSPLLAGRVRRRGGAVRRERGAVCRRRARERAPHARAREAPPRPRAGAVVEPRHRRQPRSASGARGRRHATRRRATDGRLRHLPARAQRARAAPCWCDSRTRDSSRRPARPACATSTSSSRAARSCARASPW